MKDLSKQLEESKQQVSDLKVKIRADEDQSHAPVSVGSSAPDNQQLQRTIAELQNELGKFRASKESLRNQPEEASPAGADHHPMLAALQAKLNSLEGENAQLTAKLEASGKAEAIQMSNTDLEKSKDKASGPGLKEKVAQLEEDLLTVKEENKALLRQVSESRGKLDDERFALQTLLSSFSLKSSQARMTGSCVQAKLESERIFLRTL